MRTVAHIPKNPTKEIVDAIAPNSENSHSLRLIANIQPKMANMLETNKSNIKPPKAKNGPIKDQ